MAFLHLVLHVLNFLAPAGFVALLLPAASRHVLRNPSPPLRWWLQVAIQFALGAAALLAGLLLFGVDGKMLSYLALVLSCASCQWLLTRGWQGKTAPRGR